MLGLDPTGGALSEGYLALDAGHPLAAGLPAETLQFHGTADRYRPAGAEVVAYLADDRESITMDPAVTLNRVGAGWAAAWTFDLARSVALTRQGNPALANEEHDGGEGIRAADQFVGWLDTERMEIPQADVQQRLLANLIHGVSQEKRPVPRLWYFPGEANTMLIATGDSHGNPAAAIEEVLTRVERRGGHFSVYYTAFPNDNWRRAAKRGAYEVADLGGDLLSEFLTAPSPDQIADWRARGHEFGLHPYVEEGLDVGWNRYWNEFTGLGYGPLSRTTRTHRVLWTGWAETARIQAAYGLRMNMDFYHWGPLFKNGRGEWVNGHMTGSGLPMKFVDENGRILEIYQQHTHIADDHLLDLHFGGVAGISIEEALDVMRAIIDRSLAGDFSAVTGQFHVDPFAVGGEHLPEAEKWLDVTLDYAAEKNVPIWSAEEWLRFTEVRHEVIMSQVDWQAESGRLTFSVDVATGSPAEMAVMLPIRHGSLSLAGIEQDGRDAAFTTREVAGISYGWLSLPAGSSEITAHYTN